MRAMNDTIEAAGGGEEGAMAAIPSGLMTVQNMAYTYFLFGFLWTNSFINAIAFTALSGSYVACPPLLTSLGHVACPPLHTPLGHRAT